MKNKKGFTLIELLIVLSVLLAVTSSTILGVTKIQESSKNRQYNDVINAIKMGAEAYLNNNPTKLETVLNEAGSTCITIGSLQNEGLLDLDIKDPRTNEVISTTKCVYASKINGVLSFEVSL